MKRTAFLLFFATLIVAGANSGCSFSANNNRPNTLSNSSLNSTENRAASTPATEIKYYQSTGIITEVRPESGIVELKHEEIKGLMPAMTMMSYVKNKADLQNLKVGDAVDFTLEDDRGAEKISEIKKK